MCIKSYEKLISYIFFTYLLKTNKSQNYTCVQPDGVVLKPRKSNETLKIFQFREDRIESYHIIDRTLFA
jgi:hypothetical protein